MKLPFDEIGKVKDGIVDIEKFEEWFVKQGLKREHARVSKCHLLVIKEFDNIHYNYYDDGVGIVFQIK